MPEDDETPTEDLVAAFRARKAQQVHARRAASQETPVSPAAETLPAPSLDSPRTPSRPQPGAPVQDARGTAPEPHPAGHSPSTASPVATTQGPSPNPSAVKPAQAPRSVIKAGTPPGSPLVAGSLRLSERLLADKHVSVRGSRQGRVLGGIVLAAGLAVLAADRYLHWRNPARADAIAGIAIVPAGLMVAAAGLLLLLAFCFLPPARRLQVPLAASQGDEWRRVQHDVQRLSGMEPLGWTLVGLGLAGVAASFWLLRTFAGYGAAVSGLLVLAGILVLVRTAARRAALHRLYVQTLILSSLERTGLGPGGPDPRVAPVLRALDQLLGALPESTVRRFLASTEAERYLELMDELAREPQDG